MRTLDFARRFIKFDRASLINGAWDDARYPHMRRPLSANDDLETKSLVIYKAAGCMGTVYLQIVIAKHILCDVGDIYFVAQDDDAANTWGVSRGQGFILSIPDIWRLRKASIIERSCFTQSQWRFRHLDLYITGPSKTNRQSKQIRRVFTDESHLTKNYEDGALLEFEDRTQNWDWAGSSVHATTAADAGAEVDRRYYDGRQNEYHWRCPKCDQLIWPLWREVTPSQKSAKDVYGKDIFLWDEMPTEDETLDTIRARCPHCDSIFHDTLPDRSSLIGEDYVSMNPNANRGFDSWRWNVFAVAHLQWRKVLALYRSAIASARLGNTEPLQNFAKKQLCASWTNTLPDFGDGRGESDYKVGDIWAVDDSIRIMTSDPQAGKADEGAHFRGLITQWDRDGNSRRIAARRVETFGQLDALQMEFGVKDQHVMVDSGWENRLIYRECGRRHWFCFRGSDATEILHMDGEGEKRIVHPMPYSQREPASGIVGEAQPKRLAGVRRGSLPSGWAWVIVGANPTLYGYLSALLGGASGRYFGIAKDFVVQGSKEPGEYQANMPAFIKVIEKDKKTNKDKVFWREVRATHFWDCEILALVVAMRNGYFPLGKICEQVVNSDKKESA